MNIQKQRFLPFIWLYYPFYQILIENFKEEINWNMLSKNKNVEWNYELIKKYENNLIWKYLEENEGVFKKITLHYVFPDKVAPIKCTCAEQLDRCLCDNLYEFHKQRKDLYLVDDFFKQGYSDIDEIERIAIVVSHILSEEELCKILGLKSTDIVNVSL